MPRHVLAIAQTAETGGAERALLRTVPGLRARGYEVELTVPAPGRLEDEAAALGLRTYELPVGGLEAGTWPRALASIPAARLVRRAARPDIVYFNGTVAQRLAPAFARATLVPHVHDLLEFRPRPWRSRRFWRRAPVVLCDSDAVAQRAAALGAPPARLRTVYCPVEAVPAAPRPVWAGTGAVIGFVGRIEPRKGVLDLLRALVILRRTRPDARLVLVGRDDLDASASYRREVADGVASLGSAVVALGRIEDARPLMPWFDVLCVPSHAEPFGTVAAEALAAGTPVVATRSGGMAEYVSAERNGALVPVGDPMALAAALEATLERAPQLARFAREDAARFSTERVAASVADALDEALAR
jgi:glycosyltransferase involved in cell wall biosynthesis